MAKNEDVTQEELQSRSDKVIQALSHEFHMFWMPFVVYAALVALGYIMECCGASYKRETGGVVCVLAACWGGSFAVFVGLASLVLWLVKVRDCLKDRNQLRLMRVSPLRAQDDLNRASAQVKSIEDKHYERSHSLPEQFRCGLCLALLIGGLLVLASYCLGFTRYELFEIKSAWEKVDQARFEWLTALGWGIGVVGAIWAIWAKRQADKAFKEAQAAGSHAERAADKALDAYNAVTTRAIRFDRLLAEGKLENLINDAEGEAMLLLGLPQVGLFYRKPSDSHAPGEDGVPQNYEFSLRTYARRIPRAIESMIDKVAARRKDVLIAFFDEAQRAELADAARREAEKASNKEEYLAMVENFVSDSKEFEDRIRRDAPATIHICSYHMHCTTVPPNEQMANRSFDPGLRVAIVDKSKDRAVPQEQAIVWFVSDFTDDSPSGFGAVAIETQDKALIDLFKRLVQEYFPKPPKQVPPPAAPAPAIPAAVPPAAVPPAAVPPAPGAPRTDASRAEAPEGKRDNDKQPQTSGADVRQEPLACVASVAPPVAPQPLRTTDVPPDPPVQGVAEMAVSRLNIEDALGPGRAARSDLAAAEQDNGAPKKGV